MRDIPYQRQGNPWFTRPVSTAYRADLPWLRRYVRLLVAFDAIAIGIAALVAYLVRFHGGPQWQAYLAFSIVMPFLWIAAMSLCRAYEPRFLADGYHEFKRVLNGAVRVTAAVALVSYAFRADIARGYVLLVFPLATVLALGGRQAGRIVLFRQRSLGRFRHRVLVVGNPRNAGMLADLAARNPWVGWDVVGACLDSPPRSGASLEHETDTAEIPILNPFDEVLSAIRSCRADTVVVAASRELTGDPLRRLLWKLEGSEVAVLMVSPLTDVAGPRLSIRQMDRVPLLHVAEPEFSGVRRVLKGGFDRLVALTLVVLAAPVLLVAALLVRTTSRGPALFRQQRVGVKGEPFTMVKFRSMYVDAEERLAELRGRNDGDGVLFKMREDPRITRVGGFLRKWSLDELPQLFNVVGGSMSLVGPRPPLPREVAEYGADVHRRLLVKPGITGLWQVSGRSDLPWDEAVRLDLDYVQNWSFATDLMILGRTVAAVLGRHGAY